MGNVRVRIRAAFARRRPTRRLTATRDLRFGLLAALIALLIAASPAAAATGWTGPQLVGSTGFCFDAAAAIDSAGNFHAAADCSGRIRYSTAHPGGAWSSTNFAVPNGFEELEPQVAVDGNRIYVAFSRNSPATCGFDWVGVFYRTRALPSGSWSAAIRLGSAGDHLQSFRAVGGTLYATVDNAGSVFYESSKSGVTHRYLLSDAVGLSSLRIGSDGRARIVYDGAHSLRYAVFTGSGFSKSSIPGTTADDRNAILVLDANNRAHVVWSHTTGPGCGDGEGSPLDGMYYATNAGGSWTAPAARRFTTDIGAASLTIDTATGRVHVLLGGDFGVRYYTKPGSGAWSQQKLTSAKAYSVALRLDQARGRLLAVYARQPDTNVSSSVYAFTKP